MRKFAALATALLFLFALTTVALAGSATSPSGQTQTLDVTGNAKAGAPEIVTVSVSLSCPSCPNNGKPRPTTEADVHLPTGTGYNFSKFPKCDVNKLQAATDPAAAGCNKAKVGAGSAEANAVPVVTSPVTATVQAFNGKKPKTYLLYALPTLGPVVILEGTLQGNLLKIPVPPIQTLPGQPNATITKFTVKTGKTITVKAAGATTSKAKKKKIGYITNPKKCPKGGWGWSIEFTYDNGEKLQPADTVPCHK